MVIAICEYDIYIYSMLLLHSNIVIVWDLTKEAGHF